MRSTYTMKDANDQPICKWGEKVLFSMYVYYFTLFHSETAIPPFHGWTCQYQAGSGAWHEMPIAWPIYEELECTARAPTRVQAVSPSCSPCAGSQSSIRYEERNGLIRKRTLWFMKQKIKPLSGFGFQHHKHFYSLHFVCFAFSAPMEQTDELKVSIPSESEWGVQCGVHSAQSSIFISLPFGHNRRIALPNSLFVDIHRSH